MPAASKPDVGRATHFTFLEGGVWYKWKRGSFTHAFAIKFSSGWIWDIKVGWRRP